MRIQGTNATSTAATSSAPRRSASGAFSLDTETAARPTGGPSGPRAIGGIDTLLALQSVDEPTERRRRAVKKGRGALDALEALKLGFLCGTLDSVALGRLKQAASGLNEPTGDPGLDNVMAEIALRVEVELAKNGMPNERPRAA